MKPDFAFEDIIANANDIVIVTEADPLDDPGPRIVYVNPAFTALTGYTPEEVLGRTPRILQGPDTDPDTLRRISAALHRHEPVREEILNYSKSGREYWLDMNIVPLVDADGGVRYFAAIERDLTERVAAETMKDEFISTVSHELRTPLTALRGAIGMLNPKLVPELTPTALELVDIAQRNCARLLFLINDLLDMEKLSSGGLPCNLTPLALTDVIGTALAINAPYAERHAARLAFTPPAQSLYVQGDEQRLLQVLGNLLANAARFSPEGGEVRVGLQPLDGRVRVSVCDSGEGVPEAFVPRLFQKFAQAPLRPGESRGGTGLGLAISRAIIEQHGGEIGYVPNRPKGSCFYFTLPRVAGS